VVLDFGGGPFVRSAVGLLLFYKEKSKEKSEENENMKKL